MEQWTDHPMPDLGLHVRTRKHFATLAFEVRVVIGMTGDPKPLYYADDPAAGNMTSDVERADLYASGAIRFDGCANVDWHTSECMQHACGREDMTRIGPLFDRLYDLAALAMPEHADYLRKVEA